VLRPEVHFISVDDDVAEPPHTFFDHIDPKCRDAAPRVVARRPEVEGWEWEGRFYPSRYDRSCVTSRRHTGVLPSTSGCA